MSKLTLNTNAKQPDGKYKVSSTATFDDGTHFSGHILITEAEIMELTIKDMKIETCRKLIENLEKEMKELGAQTKKSQNKAN